MDIEHVDQLLAFRGAEFVHLAYQAVLGREPDLQGQAHFVRRVEKLHDKVAIICELAMSTEGSARPQTLKGLTELVQLHEPRQGRVGRWLQRVAQGMAATRRIEVVLDQMGAQAEDRLRATQARLAGLDSQLASHSTALATQAHQTERALEQLTTMTNELVPCAQGLATLPQELRIMQQALHARLEILFAAHAAPPATTEPQEPLPSALSLRLSAADGPARFLDDLAQGLAASDEALRLSGRPAA